jgi:hypothetical protein
MALSKSITNKSGRACTYWRVTAIAMDIDHARLTIALSGYADAQTRLAGFAPDDVRYFELGPAEFAAVAGAIGAGSLYSQNAAAAYTVISTRRRTVLRDLLQSDGSVLMPSGEHVAAADVQDSGGIVTIPPEFADAVSV